jgi:microcystin-dependent protein
LTALGADGLVYTSKSAVQSVAGPTGSIAWMTANTIPVGYLAADGASISSASYPELYAVIGLTYGGDGSVFSLPDLRSEFIRGLDNGRGVDANRVIGSKQVAKTSSSDHKHFVNYVYYYSSPNNPNYSQAYGTILAPEAMQVAGTNEFGNYELQYYNHTMGLSSTVVSGEETRPQNIALLACIKY